ncbi:MAG: hypothetical protein ACOYN0_00760 [Phycisphaerales bacterium]
MMRDAWQSTSARAGEGVRFLFRGRSAIGSVLAFLFLLVVLAIITVPLLILVLLMMMGMAVSMIGRAAGRALGRAHKPNGVLDGRRNVRVRLPDQDAG